MSPYESLQQNINTVFAGYERDAIHLVALPSIIRSGVASRLGVPPENIVISKVENSSTGQLIPPQPERGAIQFDIVVHFPIKKHYPLSVTVPVAAKYDRFKYMIKCGGDDFEILNNPEVDQDDLVKVVKNIEAFIKVQVENFLAE